jgi:hypothetical protein
VWKKATDRLDFSVALSSAESAQRLFSAQNSRRDVGGLAGEKRGAFESWRRALSTTQNAAMRCFVTHDIIDDSVHSKMRDCHMHIHRI